MEFDIRILGMNGSRSGLLDGEEGSWGVEASLESLLTVLVGNNLGEAVEVISDALHESPGL